MKKKRSANRAAFISNSEGGYFQARLSFPTNYPIMPPKMRFVSDMWHPNVYHPSGEVCISILHPPGMCWTWIIFLCISSGDTFTEMRIVLNIVGEDTYGYEQSGERWMPIHTVRCCLRYTNCQHVTEDGFLTVMAAVDVGQVETIVISVISMLSSPNDESPANIQAAVSCWRFRSHFFSTLRFRKTELTRF